MADIAKIFAELASKFAQDLWKGEVKSLPPGFTTTTTTTTNSTVAVSTVNTPIPTVIPPPAITVSPPSIQENQEKEKVGGTVKQTLVSACGSFIAIAFYDFIRKKFGQK